MVGEKVFSGMHSNPHLVRRFRDCAIALLLAAGLGVHHAYGSGTSNSAPASSTSSAPRDFGCARLEYGQLSKNVVRVKKPELRYPNSELGRLGEGWAQFDFTIDEFGAPVDFRVVDGLGAPVYSKLAIEGVSTARYEPAERDGKKVGVNISDFNVYFQVEGENRAAVHGVVDMAYETAFNLRKQGKLQESLDRLRQSFKGTLNLYEQATLSFGIAISYKGLGDFRRALVHARRATANEGIFADRGIRRNAFILLSELHARDNNPADALCSFAVVKKLDPEYQPEPMLASLLDAARQTHLGSAPVQTEVQLVESERADVGASWYHPVLRRNVSIKPIEGKLDSYRLWCPTTKVVQPVGVGASIVVDEANSPCMLYVYGDAGARFVVDENGPNARAAPTMLNIR